MPVTLEYNKNQVFQLHTDYQPAGDQPKALIETWEAIWSSDLDREFKTDFEVYGPRFFEDGLHEVLVHIGIQG